MKFQIINNRGDIVFATLYGSCIPPKSQIESMLQAGYKFAIDGKTVSKKKLREILSTIDK